MKEKITRSKILGVDYCLECPYFTILYPMNEKEEYREVDRCSRTDKKIPRNVIGEKEKFPEWCPLEDEIRQMAELMKDVGEKFPLEGDFETDARHAWPKRWDALWEIAKK